MGMLQNRICKTVLVSTGLLPWSEKVSNQGRKGKISYPFFLIYIQIENNFYLLRSRLKK